MRSFAIVINIRKIESFHPEILDCGTVYNYFAKAHFVSFIGQDNLASNLEHFTKSYRHMATQASGKTHSDAQDFVHTNS